jgi:ABC-type nitrate/sulfonate/bicarbonate transport system permease component
MAIGFRAVALGGRTAATRRRTWNEPAVLGTLGLVAFVALWEFAAEEHWLNPVIVSSPTRIAAAFVQQWAAGTFLGDLGVSLSELAIGFGLSIVVGIAVGIAMGLNRDTEYALDPFVWFLYSTPLIALYPLIVVWLGFGFATVVAVAFLLTVVSIVVNTFAGVRGVDPLLIRAVRAFGANRREVIVKVILPASLPMVMAGVRIGLGRALIGVVLGEMFGANAGLGYRMTVFASRLRTADVFVPLITFVVIGVVTTQLAGLLERRLQAWKAVNR